MLAFLIVSTICVVVISWIVLACGYVTEGVETFVVGLAVGARWFFVLGIILIIIKVLA